MDFTKMIAATELDGVELSFGNYRALFGPCVA
jgi:hypothetical protein